MKRLSFVVASLVAAVVQSAHAAETDISVTPSGGVYFQFGQLRQTFDMQSQWPKKTWEQRFDFRFSLNARIEEHLRAIVGVEFTTVTLAKPPMEQGKAGTTTSQQYLFPLEGQGIYTYGDNDTCSPLQIALGYFPFKYNPQATNLGEYLFRTSIYPPIILNDFDGCKAKLLGLRLSSILLGSLRQDLLFTSEVIFQPIGDYSLSYLIGYQPFPAIDLGAGISLNRLFPLDPNLTTKHVIDNIVYDQNGIPVISGTDTLYGTFQGTKLMGRFTFDPKPLLPEAISSIMGKEDGKLYGETAILGLRDYGSSYPDLLKRWPYMVGFNIPVFKTMDVLSFEVEYFNSATDMYKLPIEEIFPAKAMLASDKNAMANRFRWSLFAQKNIAKGFAIKGLIGKDHFRATGVTGNSAILGANAPTGSDDYGGEMCVAKGDWHYIVRLMYSF